VKPIFNDDNPIESYIFPWQMWDGFDIYQSAVNNFEKNKIVKIDDLKKFIGINKNKMVNDNHNGPFNNRDIIRRLYITFKYILKYIVVIEDNIIKSDDLLEHIYKPNGIAYKQAEIEFKNNSNI